MGRIRTKDVKDLARELYEAYPDKFSPDFEQNKAAMAELKIVEGKSTRFRNRVAGYVVRLVRQAAHGHHAAGERAPEPSLPAEAEAEIEAEENEAETAEAEETEEAAEEKSE